MGKHRTYEQRIAELEARIKEQRAKIARRERLAAQAEARAANEAGPRFSSLWVASHRRKLGLSAADYGRLVGVAGLTIYNWEKRRSRPRAAQLERLAAIRRLGVREARQRLENGAAEPTRKRAARKA